MNRYLKELLEKIKKAQEENLKRENISKELGNICKQLDSFTPRILDADSKGVDLSSADKVELNNLTKKYDDLLRQLIKIEGFESPWNYKSH